ncbi:unnamed protein product [Didymodactylos carnosus]|uniref:Uncharacterized protein n=1 Tax=Didymodactylos carnosus TaxID=1234261 RepID=A0A814TCG8_9BILA|nr:unnamed protein product [Didymodactylos carnosus]CAF3923350.1 unnamed protein product [Didymodactylos carnosus]
MAAPQGHNCNQPSPILFESHQQRPTTNTASDNSEQNLISAFNYFYNKTADHSDTLLQFADTNKKHIENMYAKTHEIYPRYCVTYQIFKNAMTILDDTMYLIRFDDGDLEERSIDQTFIDAVNDATKNRFIPAHGDKNVTTLPNLYVELDTCKNMWGYYSYLFSGATTIFDISPIMNEKQKNDILSATKRHGRMILMYPLNVFCKTNFTGKDENKRMERDNFLRKWNDPLYKFFVSFWTHHKRIRAKKCNPELGSSVFLTDGHQKAECRVCLFDGVCDLGIPALGPIMTGCFETPIRSDDTKKIVLQPTLTTNTVIRVSDPGSIGETYR